MTGTVPVAKLIAANVTKQGSVTVWCSKTGTFTVENQREVDNQPDLNAVGLKYQNRFNGQNILSN